MVVAEIRPSPIAGIWYEANPQRLSRLVDGFMDAAELPPLTGHPLAVIAPHAGHRYSGPVAGYAFAAVRGLTPEVVAVIAPMHHPYPSPLLTTAHRAYGTPLGVLSVHQPLLDALDEKLKQRLGFGLKPIANDPEHSLEIELPFLQRALPSTFSLLPVMVRTQNPETCLILGQALAETLSGRNALLVGSTDLSHFYNAETAQQLDRTMLAQVEAFSPEGVLEVAEQGKGEACGLGALAAVLWAAKWLGGKSVKVLRYATSGDVTGDLQSVVGYGAAVVLRD
ncbi:MAG: AmmeMemoRadiSam system protein B [Anaerolineae bacterium]|nr:MAG: AmmeMemoRadiSam system protein B [Anaerolineae bacterium]